MRRYGPERCNICGLFSSAQTHEHCVRTRLSWTDDVDWFDEMAKFDSKSQMRLKDIDMTEYDLVSKDDHEWLVYIAWKFFFALKDINSPIAEKVLNETGFRPVGSKE